MTIVRAGVGFLLGLLIGILATVAFFIKGGSDYFVRASPMIIQLREHLGEVEQQRDRTAKRLEDLAEKFASFSERMEGRYVDLERRFLQLQRMASERPRAGAPSPAQSGGERAAEP